MKFGLFLINEKPPGGSDEQVVRNALEQCRVGDELGFDTLWLGEHHFAPYGTMPDTMVFAAAVSQVTKQIKIGTSVIVPSFQHPVRVAEQVSMLDHLSGGRFVLGVGRGYQRREFDGFGIPQDESTARFRESLAIIEGMLNNESFSYDGEFWKVSDLTLAPRPKNRIPVYVAVSRTPASFAWAVERGYGIMIGNPYSIDAATEKSQELYAAAQANAGQAVSMDHTWGLMNSVFVHEDGERARELFRQSWQIGNDFLWKYARVVEEGQEIPADYEHYAGWYDWIQYAEYDKIFDNPWTLVGSPGEIVERLHAIRELQSKFGTTIDKYIVWMNRGGCIAQEHILHSMELMATKVMPEVQNL